ncbi:MAG: iron-sulfur cluster repair di-iron protein [Flavobacteriales bacterium]|nr:iron-sulfur cluster repair di-iron protein [Flavobacteriales bacterium]MCB9447302.1 iron-sulfur cluster repair di-iron protein [Flavobacteriales bacterium]
MINKLDQVGAVVTTDYRTASVFRKHGIDFCCGGGKTIEKACQSKDANMSLLLDELNALSGETDTNESRYTEWPLTQLVDYIVDHHHVYTKRTLLELDQYLSKVEKVHGEHNPELKKIYHLFSLMAEELTVHMYKEESILFPYIQTLDEYWSKGQPAPKPGFGTIQYPIQMMEQEHEQAGDCMSEIRSLTNDYSPPSHACNTYRVSFKLLEEFEKDLHMHVHLENNILFPRAIQLEKESNQL